jgi:hypothetical protein
LMRWRQWRGHMFTNVRPRGWIWAKNKKRSVHGSVFGTLCETEMWGDAGRWWVRVDEMEAAGGLRIHQHEAKGLDLGQK